MKKSTIKSVVSQTCGVCAAGITGGVIGGTYLRYLGRHASNPVLQLATFIGSLGIAAVVYTNVSKAVERPIDAICDELGKIDFSED